MVVCWSGAMLTYATEAALSGEDTLYGKPNRIAYSTFLVALEIS